MKNCEFVTFISILACNIAKNKTQEEINILSAFFSQLRRYISNFVGFRYRLIIGIYITKKCVFPKYKILCYNANIIKFKRY